MFLLNFQFSVVGHKHTLSTLYRANSIHCMSFIAYIFIFAHDIQTDAHLMNRIQFGFHIKHTDSPQEQKGTDGLGIPYFLL